MFCRRWRLREGREGLPRVGYIDLCSRAKRGCLPLLECCGGCEDRSNSYRTGADDVLWGYALHHYCFGGEAVVLVERSSSAAPC